MSAKLSAAMWKPMLQRSAREGLSLQQQIREMLVGAILDAHVPPGVPLPSSREMAEQLGVARNTVVLAYQQLADEGYLVSRERSGHFVSERMAGAPPHADTGVARAGSSVDWPSRFRVRPSAQRSIVKPADWQKYPYPFLYGQYDPELFPLAAWRECCTKALSVLDTRDWAPDLIMKDDEALVQQIRSRVLPRRGVWAKADEIVVTMGAQHAIYLVADLLMGPGTWVGVEDPGYPDARNTFATHGAHLRPLQIDQHGLVVDEQLEGCNFIYTTPSHQCPTTVTMTRERRELLLRRAETSDFLVIEDDYEAENRFEGEPMPALKSMDRNGRVIYVGSLSKTLAPGLRLGYVVGPAELIAELRALRRLMLRHPVTYIQRAFALFLSLGHHDALLRRLAAAQRERSTLLLEALARHLPECRPTRPSGGSSLWVELPPHVDATRLAAAARERGVLVEPGDVFFANDPAPASCIRFGLVSAHASAIEPGVRELAQAMRSLD